MAGDDVDVDLLSEWRAVLAAVLRHEFAPDGLQERLDTSQGGLIEQATFDVVAFDALQVGACGSGKSGIYRSRSPAYLTSQDGARIAFCGALQMWTLTSTDTNDLPRGYVEDIYKLPKFKGRQLLYASLDPQPTGQWFTVAGFDPPPVVTPYGGALEPLGMLTCGFARADLAAGSTPLQNGIIVPAVLGVLLDARRARWLNGDRFFCETALSIARRIVDLQRHARVAAVCRRWHEVVAKYAPTWPAALREAMQLPPVHLQTPPRIRIPDLIRLLSKLSWANFRDIIPHSKLFQRHAWPVLLTSAKVSKANSEPYNTLVEVQKGFVQFARELLSGVPLPWCKCLRGNMPPDETTRNVVQCTDGICYIGGDGSSLMSCDFLGDGWRHLDAELFVGPFGFMRWDGSALTGREGVAMRALVSQAKRGETFHLLGRSHDWSFQCSHTPTKRVTLMCRQVWHFERIISSEHVDLDFEIAGRVFPFCCVEDDLENVRNEDEQNQHGAGSEQESEKSDESADEAEYDDAVEQ